MSIAGRALGRALDALVGRAGSSGAGREVLDDARLLEAQARVDGALRAATTQAQGSGATAAQQRSALDAAADQARLIGARGRDLGAASQHARESLERTKLIALNAALEGARVGDTLGKAMVAVADEVRNVASRGVEALDEASGLLTLVEGDRAKLADLVEQSRQRASQLADELLRTQASLRDAGSASDELGRMLQKSTGSDPALARAVLEAAAHAKGLVEALSRLPGGGDRGKALRALTPSFEPLLAILRELDRPGGEGAPR